MGLYSGEKEEAAIREALAAGKDIDEVVPDADDALTLDPMAALFAKLTGTAEAKGDGAAAPTGAEDSPAAPSNPSDPTGPAAPTPPAAPLATSTLYETQLDYLRQALTELYERPEEPEQRQTGGGGVSWREHGTQHVVEMVPPAGYAIACRCCRSPTCVSAVSKSTSSWRRRRRRAHVSSRRP